MVFIIIFFSFPPPPPFFFVSIFVSCCVVCPVCIRTRKTPWLGLIFSTLSLPLQAPPQRMDLERKSNVHPLECVCLFLSFFSSVWMVCTEGVGSRSSRYGSSASNLMIYTEPASIGYLTPCVKWLSERVCLWYVACWGRPLLKAFVLYTNLHIRK